MVAHKMFVTNCVLASCCGLMLLLMIWVTYKVAKLIRLNDKILLLMLIFLDLSLFCKQASSTPLCYLPFPLLIVKFYLFIDDAIAASHNYRNSDETICESMIISAAPVFFFTLAAVFNMNKW